MHFAVGDIFLGKVKIIMPGLNAAFVNVGYEKDAFLMLKNLSGKEHSVFTGVTVIKNDKEVTFSVQTKVKFFELDDREIEDYISSGEPFDKAGAYGIQGKGSLFVEKIDGDYFNVVGLPISALADTLEDEMDIKIL